MSYVFSVAGLVLYGYAMGIERVGGVIAAAATIASFALIGVDPTLLSLVAFITFALTSIRARPIFHSKAIGILLALIGAALIAIGDMSFLGLVALYSGLYIAEIYAYIINIVMGVADPTGGVFILIALMIAASFLARYVSMIRDPVIASIVAFGAAYLAIYVAAVALINLYLATYQLFEIVPIVALVVGAAAVVDMFSILERPRPEAIVWLGPLGIISSATLGLNLAPLLAALGLIVATVAIMSERSSLYVTAIFLAFSALAAAG